MMTCVRLSMVEMPRPQSPHHDSMVRKPHRKRFTKEHDIYGRGKKAGCHGDRQWLKVRMTMVDLAEWECPTHLEPHPPQETDSFPVYRRAP